MSATPTGQAQPVVSAPPPEAEAKSSAAAVPAKQELADLPPDADLRKKITHALHKAARAKGAAAKVQMALSAYGRPYKAQSPTKEFGKGQIPMRPKAGKEESEVFLSKPFRQLQATGNMVELTGQNEQLLKETWLYGYAPDFTFASPTPQGMGMLKTLAAGEVTMYIMKLSELLFPEKRQDPECRHLAGNPQHSGC